MYVQVALDQPQGNFTNLDVISGRVLLRCPTQTTISAITVKLEGESRTRLMAPPRPGTRDKPRTELEIHKVLYKTRLVFPDANTPHDPSGRNNYQISPGQYEYPFQFKVPFNNQCSTTSNTASTNINFSGFVPELSKSPTQHVKATLPPSVYFPGEAEIRYYVKVTVNRPSLLKENPRAFAPFNFVPIEPPRPSAQGEMYARRQHQFLENPFDAAGDKGSSVSGMFKSKAATTPTSPGGENPVRLSLDARLPNPGILTCGQDVPIRVLFKQLSQRSQPLFLQTLQIELIGHTKVRAHDVHRTESTSWVIISRSNLHHAIGSAADAVDTETELTKEFWYGHNLPDTVAPSFTTCNMSRYYELVVSVGLSYGASSAGKDQFVVLPLRLQVEVYSGIKPPDELLKRVAEQPAHRPNAPVINANPYATNRPPGQGTGPSAAPPGYEEPPPSYEDAVSSDLPPLAGPRPAYHPPAPQPGEHGLFADHKG